MKGCGECAGNDSKAAQRKFKFACKKQNIKCLDKYIQVHKKVRFECKICGHEWSTTPASINNGTGCKKCANARLSKAKLHSISLVRRMIKSKGYTLKSTTYIDSAQKLDLFCPKPGHGAFRKSAGAIKQNSGCVKCWNERRRIIPEHRKDKEMLMIRQVCKKNHWILVTKDYPGATVKLHLKCSVGHDFHLLKSQIKNGVGCILCSSGRGERTCRVAIEWLTGEPFPRVRPKILKNKTGRNLELDGYSAKYNLAFEYQGRQHDEFIPLFHKSIHDYKNQEAKDNLKRQLCIENGIKLIEVPDGLSNIELLELLKEELKDAGVPIVTKLMSEPDWSLSYVPKFKKYHDLAQSYADKNNWELKNELIISSTTDKIEFRCKTHGLFKQSLHKLNAGRGCPKCGHKRRWATRRYK